MKSLNRILILLMMISCMFFQSGCWDQKIFERIGFMLQLGLELDEDGKILYTAGVPLVSPEAEQKIEILTTTVKLMREGRDKIRKTSGKTVEGGKVQHVYFSEDIAKRGISEFLEIFVRNAENPLLSNIIVVEGSPNELMKLSKEFKDKPRPTFYMNDLLEGARRNSYVPETRISHFTIRTHSGSIDPTTPLISYSRDQIRIEGTALFSGDKLVGKINASDTGLLTGLMGKKTDINYIYRGEYSQEKQEDLKSGAAILMRNKDRKIKINTEGAKPVIDIKLDFKASITEYAGELDLTVPEEKKKLEEAVAEAIAEDCLKLLNHLVEVGSDPIGFGEIIRTKHSKYWKSSKWKDNYKDAVFIVEVKIKFEFYGAVSNP
jgi:spore germination protein